MHTLSRLLSSFDRDATHDCAYVGLLNRIADPVVVLDSEQGVLFTNSAAERSLFGMGETVGHPLVARAHADDAGRVRMACDHALSTPAPVAATECRYRSRDGQWRLFDITAQCWREEGRSPSIVVVARDVTDDRAHELRRNESAMLEAAAHASALVARDVDALLREMGRHLDLVMSTPDAAAQGEALRMRSTIDRAWVLVKQLHSFDAPDAGQEAVSVDVNEAVAGVASHLGRLAGSAVDVIHLLGAEQARVGMSRGDVEEVLAALIVRARRAIRAGGRIVIETRDGIDESWTPAAGTAPTRTVVVQVTDSGFGIDAATRARLESDSDLEDDAGGDDRVRVLVSRAGGRVSVASDAVLGTSVRLHLPLMSGGPHR